MTDTTEPLDAVEELLARCLAAPDDERERAVEQACARHPEYADALRARVDALAAMGIPLVSTAASATPERLGEFRLLRRLGGGGMGVVYLAEQTSLGRQVALKLIRPEHLYFRAARERFRREVEAVARLQHPGIVPVHVVGEEDGVPFFAMEHAPGCTLAKLLDTLSGRAPESLTGADMASAMEELCPDEDVARDGPPFDGPWVEACLHVAAQVADALEHAHGRGIVHRDVKPSNIMLTPSGRARLLDFGLTSSGGTDGLTRTGSALGTVPYMSPEQIRDPRTVDRRTDVYSLGVVLYELLTLQMPYRGESVPDTQRLVLDGRADSIRARNRRVRPDVATVCLVAMDRDAARRYATAADFRRDMDRARQWEPIGARPPGPLLRLRRWARRNPARAAAVVLGALLFVVVPAAFLAQQQAYLTEIEDALSLETAAREQAAREALAAQQVSDFLVGLFEGSQPDHSRGDTLLARDLLDAGARRLDDELHDQPAVRARLLGLLGNVYHLLGLDRRAEPLLAESLELLRAAPDAPPGALAETQLLLGVAVGSWGGDGRGEALLRGVLELDEDEVSAPTAALTLAHLADLLTAAGRYEEAAPLFEEALARAATIEDFELSRSRILVNQGRMYGQQARWAEAEACQRAALEIQRPLVGPVHSALVETLVNLSRPLAFSGQGEEARDCLLEALELARAIGGDEFEQVPRVLVKLAGILELQDDLAGADARLVEALEIFRRTVGNAHAQVCEALQLRGRIAARRGRHLEAAALFVECLPIQHEVMGDDHLYVGITLQELGSSLFELARHAEAEEMLRRGRAILVERLGEDHPRVAYTRKWLARVLLATGRVEEARVELERAEHALTDVPGWEEELEAVRGLLGEPAGG